MKLSVTENNGDTYKTASENIYFGLFNHFQSFRIEIWNNNKGVLRHQRDEVGYPGYD